MEANKKPVPVKANDTNKDVKVEEEPEVLQFTKMMYNAGRIPKEQVDAMEMFTKGEMDYGTMRNLCG